MPVNIYPNDISVGGRQNCISIKQVNIYMS